MAAVSSVRTIVVPAFGVGFQRRLMAPGGALALNVASPRLASVLQRRVRRHFVVLWPNMASWGVATLGVGFPTPFTKASRGSPEVNVMSFGGVGMIGIAPLGVVFVAFQWHPLNYLC
jgi:hypothetical protein